MKALEYSMIFSFSKKAGLGNPAGVVWDAAGLSQDDMQKIAKMNGHSETAFVILKNKAVNPYAIKFYTPRRSISMCGHASIAAAYFYWKHMGMPDQLKYVQSTDSGNLMIKIAVKSSKSFAPKIAIEMDIPRLDAVLTEIKQDIVRALGLDLDDIHGEWPIVKNEKGYLFVPIKSLDAFEKIKLNTDLMTQIDGENDLHGWFLFTDETHNSENNYHCRFFAPSLGVDEDPVTGTANAYFGIYHQAYIGDGGDCTLNNEQGTEIGMGGTVEIEYKVEDGRVSEIWAGGYATEYIEGKIRY